MSHARPGPAALDVRRVAGAIGLFDEDGSTPLYQRLFQRIRRLIAEGVLQPGVRLPASRTLADSLGISRNSVLLAFDQLAADGWVESRRGSGVYVARALPSPGAAQDRRRTLQPPQDAVPFALGVPALDLFPIETWNRLQSRRWRNMPARALAEGHGAGWSELRDAIAAYLAVTRGLPCTGAQVVVTTSVRAGIDLVVRVLGLAETSAWVEEPGYFGFKEALKANDIRLSPIPVDDQGLDVEAAMARDPAARLVVVTPACHFPTGAEMSPARRRRLIDWADGGGWIFEDDYDSENRFEGQALPPIAAAAPQSTIYLNSFNRMLFPSLRIAFMVVPEHLVEAMAEARGAIDGHSNVPNQMVMADFINGGHLDDHVRRCRAAYQERQLVLFDAARRTLAEHLTLRPRCSGLQAVADLHHLTEAEACRRARAEGVEVIGMGRFLDAPAAREQLVLGFAAFPPKEIYSATARLAGALSTTSTVAAPAIGQASAIRPSISPISRRPASPR